MTNEELASFEPLSAEEASSFIKELAKTNYEDYIYLKAAEECLELGEILLKVVNKKDSPKAPTMEQISDELSDVLLRLAIFTERTEISMDKVEERSSRKLAKLRQLQKEGKYPGRI